MLPDEVVALDLPKVLITLLVLRLVLILAVGLAACTSPEPVEPVDAVGLELVTVPFWTVSGSTPSATPTTVSGE